MTIRYKGHSGTLFTNGLIGHRTFLASTTTRIRALKTPPLLETRATLMEGTEHPGPNLIRKLENYSDLPYLVSPFRSGRTLVLEPVATTGPLLAARALQALTDDETCDN